MKKDRVLDIPIVQITENSKIHQYTRFHSTEGIPFYVPPEYKNSATNLYEFILLPISSNDFHKNTKNYFFGYRILMGINVDDASRLIDDMLVGLIEANIDYEIGRIRFYPDRVGVVIDKTYDVIAPTQRLVIEGREEPIS